VRWRTHSADGATADVITAQARLRRDCAHQSPFILSDRSARLSGPLLRASFWPHALIALLIPGTLYLLPGRNPLKPRVGTFTRDGPQQSMRCLRANLQSKARHLPAQTHTHPDTTEIPLQHRGLPFPRNLSKRRPAEAHAESSRHAKAQGTSHAGSSSRRLQPVSTTAAFDKS